MIEKRHTVRKYLDKPLDVDLISLLNARIEQNNELYDLTLKLVINNINVNLKMYSFDHLRMYNIDHINTCCSSR